MAKVIKISKKSIKTREFSAEIRNKLQTATTALEFLKAGKEVSKDLIDKALKDLEKIEEMIT